MKHVGTGCTVRRRCTEKCLTASSYLIYQAPWSGSSVEVCLGADFWHRGHRRLQLPSTSNVHSHLATRQECTDTTRWPHALSYIQKKLLDNELQQASCPYKTLNLRCAIFVLGTECCERSLHRERCFHQIWTQWGKLSKFKTANKSSHQHS